MASSTIITVLLNPSPSRCTENVLDLSNTYSGGKALLLFGHLSAEIYLQFEPNNTKLRPILTQNARLLMRNYSRFGVKAEEFVAGNIETRFLQGTGLFSRIIFGAGSKEKGEETNGKDHQMTARTAT